MVQLYLSTGGIITSDIYELLNLHCSISDKNITFHPLQLKDIVFKKRNAVLCFYCGNYSKKWTCPPKIPDVDYEQVFSEYDNFALLHIKLDSRYDSSRADSSILLHKELLIMEQILYDNNYPTRLSFIGGSCKLCKNGCADDCCRQPYKARIPLEATGVDVIETCKNVGMEIVFPVGKYLTRTGLIMW